MTDSGIKQKHILIIDDDALVLKMLLDVFKTRGYKVTTESNSIHAIQQHRDVDLIILDLMLSKNRPLEGIGVIEYMRESSFYIPVIIYSGHIKRQHIKEGLERAIQLFGKGNAVYKFIDKSENLQPLIDTVEKFFQDKESKSVPS
jgi:CheY-like chemotaxis protein